MSSNFSCGVGSLVEAYDEWGTRYTIPVYCLSNPLNLTSHTDRDSPAEFSEPILTSASASVERLRTGEDVKAWLYILPKNPFLSPVVGCVSLKSLSFPYFPLGE